MQMHEAYDRLAEFYDDDMGRNIGTADIPLYLGYARSLNPVLELGCGTGRIMQPLVEINIPVLGLDNSQAMLERASIKLDPYERTLWKLQKGELADFESECGFALAICAFSTYSKMLDTSSQQGFFYSVLKSLNPGGTLVMEMFIQGETFDALPKGTPIEDYADRPTKGGTLTRSKTIYPDVMPQVNKIVLDYTLTSDDGQQTSFVVEDYTRYSLPEELLSLVETCGFTIRNLYGDYGKSPYKEGDSRIILEAQRMQP